MLIIDSQPIRYCDNKQKTMPMFVDHCWQLMKASIVREKERIVSTNQERINEELKTALTRFLVNSSDHQSIYQALFQRWLLSNDTPCSELVHANSLERQYNQIHELPRKQVRRYHHWFEVALALDGTIVSQKLWLHDKKLAQCHYENSYLVILLNNAIYKFYQHIQEIKKSDVDFYNVLTMELLSGQTIIRNTSLSLQLQPASPFGRFRTSYKEVGVTNEHSINAKALPLDVLKKPHDYSVFEKIITLLDMSEYFGEQQPNNPETAGQWLLLHGPLSKLTVSAYSSAGNCITQLRLCDNEIVERGENRRLLGLGENSQCRDECAPSTLLARKLALPLCAGHSIITSQLLNMMTQWGDCDSYELTALSHALSAFWRLSAAPNDYSRHSMHEVFDIAKNYGVHYHLSEDRAVGESQEFDHITLGYFCKYIENTGSEIISLINTIEAGLIRINELSSTDGFNRKVLLHNNWQQILKEKKKASQKIVNLVIQTLCQHNKNNSLKNEHELILSVQESLYCLLNILSYVKRLNLVTYQSLAD